VQNAVFLFFNEKPKCKRRGQGGGGGGGGGGVSSGWLKIYSNMHKTWEYNLYCALAMLLSRQNGNEAIRTKVQIMFKGMLYIFRQIGSCHFVNPLAISAAISQ
jgi:hypothetical protein